MLLCVQLILVVYQVRSMLGIILHAHPSPQVPCLSEPSHGQILKHESIEENALNCEQCFPHIDPVLVKQLLHDVGRDTPYQVKKEIARIGLLALGTDIVVGAPHEIGHHLVWVHAVARDYHLRQKGVPQDYQ